MNRLMILNSLSKHETLTITDIAQEGNLGVVPDKAHLNYLINGLLESGHIRALNGAVPSTYTITTKGIQEGAGLQIS